MTILVEATNGGFKVTDNANALAVWGRPSDTTTYTVGDLIAGSTTSTLITPLYFPNLASVTGNPIAVTGAVVRKSGTTLTNASVRLHLFTQQPVLTVGDNGELNTSGVMALTSLEGHIGYIDVTMDFSASAGAIGRGTPTSPTSDFIVCAPASGGLWGLLEDRGGYAPASSEKYFVSIEGMR